MSNNFFGLVTTSLVFIFISSSSYAKNIDVSVKNESVKTKCAEEDNVSYSFTAKNISSFTLDAVPPSYLEKLKDDKSEADFTDCHFQENANPVYHFKPREPVVLYEDEDSKIVGLTMETYWRPSIVPLTINGKTERGFQLLQFFRKRPTDGAMVEIFVMYPPDGYWRAKPFTPPHLGQGAYGSSFLIGPVETGIRPAVNIAALDITAKPLSIKMHFATGGEALVTPAEVSEKRTALDVKFLSAIDGKYPFAQLRSMYVTPEKADTSQVTWTKKDTDQSIIHSVMDASSFESQTIRFGRDTISNHNRTAPDYLFSKFKQSAG